MGTHWQGQANVWARWAMAALGVVVLSAAMASAAAGPAYVVKDLTTGTERGASSEPGPFIDLGHTTVFTARDEAHGRELWRTDGTDAGTVLVKDLLPGPEDGVAQSRPWRHAVGDGVLYFLSQGALWRSDGTGEGTYRLADVTPRSMVVDGDRLYAAVAFDYTGFDLVRIDLPGGAVTRLGEFRGGEIAPSLTMVAGRLFFAAVGGSEGLWTSDGTPAGTRLVRAVQLANREGGNDDTNLYGVGGQLFFTATDEAGWELWRSDGSEAGTVRIRDIDPGPASGIHFNDYLESAQPFFGALGDVLVFMADDGASGLEPWRSDGTEAGTVPIADVWPGRLGVDGTGGDDDRSDAAQSIVRLVPFAGRLFFTARSAENGPVELWATSGTFATTLRVAPLDGAIGNLGAAVADEQRLYISGYSGLWASDGTAAGSATLTIIDQVDHLATVAGGVVFSARDDVGFEPRVSDGTAAGTHLLADLVRGLPGLDPQLLTDLDGTLLFSADDGARGRELWRSDGTAAGTRLVADLAAGAAGSFPVELVTSGARLYFSADDGQGSVLWRSDGTAAGTVRVGSPSEPIGLAGDGRGGVYFYADEPSRGSFWFSDGTPAGTRLLRAGDDGFGLDGQPAVALDDIAVVVLWTPGAGHELWRTDGTAAGTVPLVDLSTDGEWVSTSPLVRLGSAVLFFANHQNGHVVLWRSDGTAAGTIKLQTLGGEIYDVTAGDDGRIYFNARETLQGYRLWQSDGTSSGTFAVASARHVNPIQVATAGGRTFTVTSRARQTVFGEIGCVDLLETVPAFSTFGSLTGFGERLLFAEPLPSGAQRLWGSDGTRAGTVAVDELAATAVPGNVAPLQFVRSGGRVFFAARQGDSGTELWAVPLSAVPRVRSAPCELPPTPTPVPGRPTPGSFDCPTGDRCTVLEIEPVRGRAGERVTITVVLHARDLEIAGVQNDITLPPGMVVLENEDGDPACTVEPSIDKDGAAFAFQPPACTPGENCSAFRALILALDNTDPIYDGAVLYRCELLLANDLEPGDHALALSNLGAADPDGGAVALDSIDGIVTVEDQSGTRPIDASAGGSDGCQTAAPDGAIATVWPLLAALALLRRRRHPM